MTAHNRMADPLLAQVTKATKPATKMQ
jgi:hypothetical protein